IKANPVRAVARHQRGAPVAGPGTHRVQRLGDPAGHELVMARRLRALTALDRPLAVLTRPTPRLLARQQLGKHMRPAAPRGAPITLAAVARPAIGAIELHPRTRMLRPRAPHPRRARPRHAPKLAPHPDGLAQREATGGPGLEQGGLGGLLGLALRLQAALAL